MVESPDQQESEAQEGQTSDEELSRLQMLWNQSWSALFKALAISVVLHLVAALVILFNPSLPGDFELGWEGRMGELAGLGHGSAEFDRDEDVDWDEMAEFQTAARGADEEEKEPPDKPEEPEEDPEEVDAEEEEAEPEPREVEETELAEVEPDEIDPDAEADPRPGDEPAPEPTPERQEEEGLDEPTREQRMREAMAEGLPGVERSGPSNLPDMRNYGPGNARVTALFRTDRMRDTPLAPHVSDLLQAVPDYRIALEGTDLDPVEDLDSIFMASSNPEYLHNTFLAARHGFEHDEMRTILDRRFGNAIEWEVDGDRPVRRMVPDSARYSDPRRLMLAAPGLMIMGQPHWFEELIGPVDENSDLGRELAEAQGELSAFTLLEGLKQIEDIAENDDTLVLFSAYGVTFKDAPIINQIPPIQGIRLAVNDIDAPSLAIDLHMRSERGARDMERNCPNLRNQARMVAGLFGFASLVQPLRCRRDGEYVIIEGEYTQEDLVQILERAPAMVEAIEPRALRHLPDPERQEN